MNGKTTTVQFATILASCSVGIGVQPLIESTFDSGDEGWDYFDGESWGGHWNSGGYMEEFNRRNIGGFLPGFAIAPATFHGDWAAAYGGEFRYDFNTTHIPVETFDDDVIIAGGGLEMAFSHEISWANEWRTLSAPLVVGAGWQIAGVEATEQQLFQVLSDVTSVRIHMEYSDWRLGGRLHFYDNVAVVPGPGLWACTVLGVAVIGSGRRRSARV